MDKVKKIAKFFVSHPKVTLAALVVVSILALYLGIF